MEDLDKISLRLGTEQETSKYEIGRCCHTGIPHNLIFDNAVAILHVLCLNRYMCAHSSFEQTGATRQPENRFCYYSLRPIM